MHDVSAESLLMDAHVDGKKPHRQVLQPSLLGFAFTTRFLFMLILCSLSKCNPDLPVQATQAQTWRQKEQGGRRAQLLKYSLFQTAHLLEISSVKPECGTRVFCP